MHSAIVVSKRTFLLAAALFCIHTPPFIRLRGASADGRQAAAPTTTGAPRTLLSPAPPAATAIMSAAAGSAAAAAAHAAAKPPGIVRLVLAGDVMIGRGVDQVLPHHAAPALFESYVRDARDYVALAEEVGCVCWRGWEGESLARLCCCSACRSEGLSEPTCSRQRNCYHHPLAHALSPEKRSAAAASWLGLRMGLHAAGYGLTAT